MVDKLLYPNFDDTALSEVDEGGGFYQRLVLIDLSLQFDLRLSIVSWRRRNGMFK